MRAKAIAFTLTMLLPTKTPFGFHSPCFALQSARKNVGVGFNFSLEEKGRAGTGHFSG
jgi:hypothetical protein